MRRRRPMGEHVDMTIGIAAGRPGPLLQGDRFISDSEVQLDIDSVGAAVSTHRAQRVSPAPYSGLLMGFEALKDD